MKNPKVLKLLAVYSVWIFMMFLWFWLAYDTKIEIDRIRKINVVQEKIIKSIGSFFRINGINDKTKDMFVSVFRKCESSGESILLREICKEVNFNFLWKIKISPIEISKIKDDFKKNKELKKYYFWGWPNPEGFVCPYQKMNSDWKSMDRGPCPMKPLLKNPNSRSSVWYTLGDYILWIFTNAISEFGNREEMEHPEKFFHDSFVWVAIAKKWDTHRQPLFQMREIGKWVGKWNDVVYIKNKKWKIVVGVMEDYGDSPDYEKWFYGDAIFREFTLQDDNSWKFTACTKRKLLNPQIDWGQELIYWFDEVYKEAGKINPFYKKTELPLVRCGNEVEITTVLYVEE